MKRLTKRDEYGNADIIGVDSAELQCDLEYDEFNKVTEALNKLASYEETGLEPDDINWYKVTLREAEREIEYLRQELKNG